MSIEYMNRVWDESIVDRWILRHSDAWHPGDREDCEHCQLMIEWFGEMPPAALIQARASGRRLITKPGKTPIPVDVRWEVWERNNFTCQHCGARRYLSVDHVIPESRGGTCDITNLQTLCRRCNSKKAVK
jgi:hypothetical protein